MKNPPDDKSVKDILKAFPEISIPNVDSFDVKEMFESGNLCLQLWAESRERKRKARRDSLMKKIPEIPESMLDEEANTDFGLDSFVDFQAYLDNAAWEPIVVDEPLNHNNYALYEDSYSGSGASTTMPRTVCLTGMHGNTERNFGNMFGPYHGMPIRGSPANGAVPSLEAADHSREVHSVDIEDCYIYRARPESVPMSPPASVAAP
jgi:hypothetical protein